MKKKRSPRETNDWVKILHSPWYLDECLKPWQAVRVTMRPGMGWARAIREAMELSTTEMGRRIGMSHAGVRKLELSELAMMISLASLYKLAEGLDCDLRYVLLPRTPLTQRHNERVEALFRQMGWR
ncbi:MAG: helix-turn-helix domain-containing protein [Betaproteobacteria bacterium]|nr:helix-turn-helix domain-containing protein [Betaproteobacteria bacterium]